MLSNRLRRKERCFAYHLRLSESVSPGAIHSRTGTNNEALAIAK